MTRYKVTVYIEDNIKNIASCEGAIGGMVDRVLDEEFKTNKSEGRPGGYVNCRAYEQCEVERLSAAKCTACDGTGEVHS